MLPLSSRVCAGCRWSIRRVVSKKLWPALLTGFLKYCCGNRKRPLASAACLQSAVALKDIVFVVGPEGGFSDAEAELARRHGFTAAGLGTTILRAETAPLAVLAIIGYETGTIG